MNKILSGGIAATLVASGLGLAAAPAQAAPAPTSSTRLAGALPLDLCDVLPLLCEAPIVGDLLDGVDTALADLLGASPGGTPAAVEGLVQAIIDTLTGVPLGDQQAVADAIAGQLQGSGLDPSVLTQVLAGLGLSGDVPSASALNDLVETVQALVTGLLGGGGQTPDPAQVQTLVDQILAALAGGDPAALQGVLSGLLTSLPGGSGLDPSLLTSLVNELVGVLQSAGGGGASTPAAINRVNAALNPAPSIRSAKYFTSRRPTIRGTGTAGAAVVVRTTSGTVLGKGTVSSGGTFAVVSRKLTLKSYTVAATQTPPGRVASDRSAARTFRVVSAKPVIKTSAKKKFATHRPTVKGVAYPGSKITLKSSSGKKLGSVKVRSNGTWAIKTKRLSSGTTKVKAVQTGHGKKKTTKAKKIRVR